MLLCRAASLGLGLRALSTQQAVPITVARGDGIGPEITDATMKILSAAGAKLAPEYITVGEQLYNAGITSGLDKAAWESINRTRVLLKGPITTPLGKGVKSLNVTLRKTLGLFSNVRPVFSYSPFVSALHPKMDVVIIRENEEDLYAGIEHRQTAEVVQCLKLITVPGCERIIRYAFEYCRQQNRKKLTCVTKSNIMKLTDGTFQSIFEKMAQSYPDIKTNHEIVDIATARVAARPQNYDVIVTLNLYGDIISDVAAEVAGSVGLAGSANIGSKYAMFEAIHGSAPDIAGQDKANPAGMLSGAIMMLNYLGDHETATTVHNALLRTIEDGVHTPDIRSPLTKLPVGTQDFAAAIVDRLGKKPEQLAPVNYVSGEASSSKAADKSGAQSHKEPVLTVPTKQFFGIDVFVDYNPAPLSPSEPHRCPERLSRLLRACEGGDFKLSMISNRGVLVWPNGHPDTFKADHWRCRFEATHPGANVIGLLTRLAAAEKPGVAPAEAQSVEVIKTENLYLFDGEPGFSRGQGQ